jgi:hypothetical protein
MTAQACFDSLKSEFEKFQPRIEKLEAENQELRQLLVELTAVVDEFSSAKEEMVNLSRKVKLAMCIDDINKNLTTVGETGNAKISASGTIAKTTDKKVIKPLTVKNWFLERLADRDTIVINRESLGKPNLNYIDAVCLKFKSVGEYVKNSKCADTEAGIKKLCTGIWTLISTKEKNVHEWVTEKYNIYIEEFKIQQHEKLNEQVEL